MRREKRHRREAESPRLRLSPPPDGYIILEDVPEPKWPRCCFCRRPRFVLLHLLQDTAGITPHNTPPWTAVIARYLVKHITTATMMAICTAPMMEAMRT